jgi:hypothetical protein
MENSVTLQQALALVRQLSPVDKARLIGQIVPDIERELQAARTAPKIPAWTVARPRHHRRGNRPGTTRNVGPLSPGGRKQPRGQKNVQRYTSRRCLTRTTVTVCSSSSIW